MNKAYDYVRSRLLRGDLPTGSRLRYATFAREIGVSVTPVREAIGKLASEGLVELLPRRGAIVRRLSRSEIIDTYEVREVLEGYAARRAAERISELQLRRLRELVRTMRTLAHAFRDSHQTHMPDEMVRPFNAADLEFHMIIIESTRNDQLSRTTSDCHVVSRIFECKRWESFDLPLVASAYAFHRRICRALTRRDGDKAKRLMQAHIRHGLDVAMTALGDKNAAEWWRAE